MPAQAPAPRGRPAGSQVMGRRVQREPDGSEFSTDQTCTGGSTEAETHRQVDLAARDVERTNSRKEIYLQLGMSFVKRNDARYDDRV